MKLPITVRILRRGEIPTRGRQYDPKSRLIREWWTVGRIEFTLNF